MKWFLCDSNFRHERVKLVFLQVGILNTGKIVDS